MNHASGTKAAENNQSAHNSNSGQRSFFSAPIQAKLAVNPSNDKYEREADHIADQVVQQPTAPTFFSSVSAGTIQQKTNLADGIMRMPAHSPVQKCAECEKEQKQQINSHINVQRKCADCEKKEQLQRKEGIPSVVQTKGGEATHTSDALTASIQNSRGKGTGLDNSTQGYMESRFGADFSSVKVHTGSQATDMNRQLNAKAFTVGNDIYFNEGKYQPHSNDGKHLLAHELTHVVQQTGTVQKKPDPKIIDENVPGFEIYRTLIPKATTKENLKTLKEIDPGVTRLLILQGRTLNIYDDKDKFLKSFTLRDTIVIPYFYYYIINDRFWIVIVDDKGNIALQGKRAAVTDEEKEMEKKLNHSFTIDNWFEKPEDGKEFLKIVGEQQASMVSMPVADKNSNTPQQKDGPVLSVSYPDWFKELKTKLESLLAEERIANKDNPTLPDKMFFYGSDKVQMQKGTDAWTIEVEKGKREAYLTVTKTEWEAAQDKDAYAKQTMGYLYRKVQLMADEANMTKEEEKEINQIDGTGEKKKGSKWGWAVKLKNTIVQLLDQQKKTETEAKDFPDKLTLNIAEIEGSSSVYLRVWTYKEKKDAQPTDLPELVGGTLPVPLKETDKAEDWVPVIRRAASAIRAGNVTTDPNAKGSGQGQEGGDPTVLPPYPSHIHPFDLNPDLTTATIASNNFRMIVDTAAVHGSNTLNLTTLHMAMNIYYSWKVFPLPEALKQLKLDPNTPQPQYLQSANDYTKKNSSSLGDAKDDHDADYDWEQEIDMEDLGEGEFLLLSKAAIGYPEDWNMKRQASVAGLPFTVKKAEDMAKASAMGDTNAVEEMKKDAAKETDPKKKALMEQQVKDLEAREKTDLLTLTQKDAKETLKLIKSAGKLKEYILDDRKKKIPFSGNKDYDPFMVRLKPHQELYSLYILVRQVFDYRYDDITAIDEYTKLIQQQYDELNKMETRIGRMTDNSNLRKDLPVHRCVAALVKEDDGNLVPLTLMVGHHKDSDPANGKFKMMVLDVTFDSKKGDMTYVGGTEESEKAAIHSAFGEFGDDNKYGDGKIVYRVAGTNFSGSVDSDTTFTEYLGYALAAVGIALLIAGAVASGGLLAPAAAAAVGGVVTALGIGVAVAGAVLAARNIYKRVEKGTFELDAEFAIDIVSIIGAFVQIVGTTGRLMANMSRTVGAVQRTLTIQRLDKLLLIYDAVELGGNAVLVGLKVHEDIQAIKELGLSKEQEDEMMQQVAMEAIQSGAMLAYASFSKIKDVGEHLSARIERSRYKSFRERGWVDENSKPTELAPPFMHKAAAEPGKVPGKLQQGDQAKKETLIMEMSVRNTSDQQHKITITERGRIIRCSEFCSDLRMKYNEVLEKDPWMNKEMVELEAKAQAAAKSGNKQEAEGVAKAAVDFEAKLKQADDLRRHLFGMSEQEIDDAIEAATAGHVSGGQKSGYKVDDTRMPKRQRRQIDVTDIMTEDELKELGKGGYKKAMDRINVVMGKKISDIPELKQHWDSARADLLKGKPVTDYDRDTLIGMYKDGQRKFWANVRKDPKAVEFLKKQGFEFEGDSGAPLAVLGSKGKEATTRGNVTNQERRISLDHIEEKAQGENWQKALDGDNLELMFQNANSWKEIVQVKFGMREEVTEN